MVRNKMERQLKYRFHGFNRYLYILYIYKLYRDSCKTCETGENLLWAFLSFRRVSKEEDINRQKSMAYLNFVGLSEKAYELAANLSYAEQKLLSFARLLATEAQLILLDEPTS